MAEGTLIAESLRLDAPLRGLRFEVTEIRRQSFDGLPAGQPDTWTFVEFQVDDDLAPHLAMTLADVLDDAGGWYCDLRTATDTFVVFPRRVFRYPRGDAEQRAVAERHARSIGIPEAQLDWPE
jgi:hypothetical protein